MTKKYFLVMHKSALNILLSYIGIVGGAISIFANLQTLVDFADWVRFVILHWTAWTQKFWNYIFAWFSIDVTEYTAATLTFTAFALTTILSVRFQYGPPDLHPAKQWRSRIVDNVFYKPGPVDKAFVIFGLAAILATMIFTAPTKTTYSVVELAQVFAPLLSIVVFGYAVYVSWKKRKTLSLSQEERDYRRFSNWVVLLLLIINLIFFIPVFPKPFDGPTVSMVQLQEFLWPAITVASVIGAVALLLVPPRPLIKRLVILLLLVVTLLALNELSKLGLVLKAPAVPKI